MSKLTPMLKQYFEIKEKYPEAILFFRMGDFYEMFFEDAVKVAPLLEITLTSRSKYHNQDIPMCGVPYHSVEPYIAKLIKAGLKVAVCDQIEDPRTAKGIVARKVTRVVTPGMVISPEIEDPKSPLYLAALTAKDKEQFGLAVLEVSTGDFILTEINGEQALISELSRLAPAETLISENAPGDLADLLKEMSLYHTVFEEAAFEYSRARSVLINHFGEYALAGFGVEDMPLGLTAAGAALLYAEENQEQNLEHVDRLRCYRLQEYMVLDEIARRNLELFTNLRDNSRPGSLVSLIDLTVTAMGSRKLREWISYPLRNRTQIAERHESVEMLALDGLRRSDLREILNGVYDLERLTGRISLNRANPRDLITLKESLRRLPQIKSLLLELNEGQLRDFGWKLDELTDIADLIEKALNDNPPLTLKDGGVIRPGYNPELDELISIMSDGKGWIARMEAEERDRTNISSLKVGFNKVFGYYIEVTRSNLDQVPDNYIRRQTLTNAERFITPELKEWESKVLSAEEKRVILEQKFFEELRQDLMAYVSRLRETADLIAEIDALASLAEAAIKYDYVRPELLDEDRIEIVDGRHPVIERSLPQGAFVPNDIILDNESNQILIITGPNMAGKSTILRQVALIVLLNQIGSFVPANQAMLGIVDRIFTRIGASDDLTRGRSTFMIEMNETAQILNQATSKSLVILDEIGRGTSTFDGLSIAWAVVEFMHELEGHGVRTLFATHYHELVELAKTRSRVKNYNVSVKQWRDEIIFLRKLIPGGTSHSYGLAVARLAGLPSEILDRAAEILENLEREEIDLSGLPRPVRSNSGRNQDIDQLSLFTKLEEGLADEIQRLDPDTMTPLEALQKLAELKKMIQ
ncbi:MAG: DNA mismatch repair protein MutS [Deltaproteobacteria bacterium]|nr:DNA mismatch repair protein MutS [Deltaproteobacteria bacterium]MBW2051351.1 DNA mismatch repair protein MutS [Deltaproteobacteria bacterium]MBW2139702.1 DNA mismatch repair protein MutS [Deltaproteobacteria bacterium]